MAERERPQIYLVSPPDFELSAFCNVLAAVLDSHEVACVRLALATRYEDRLLRAADAFREVAHERNVAVVIESHVRLVGPHGLDGVHLSDGSRSVRKVRTHLGGDAIVGAFCNSSRHDGITAGEACADYVSFGPVRGSSLGDGTVASRALFEWWSEMIELPVVAEGGLNEELVRSLSPVTDFFGIGEEIWREDDPVEALARLTSAIS